MGTLATLLAKKGIVTPERRYWANVEGDIEKADNVLKIIPIRVKYHLKVPRGKVDEAREALASYLAFCPAAQSVMGCIEIQHEATIEELAGEGK